MIQQKRLTVAVLALVALAGCVGAISGDGDGETLEYVPAEAESVVQAQASLLADEETSELFEQAAEEDPAMDDDIESAIEEFEEETGLDAEGFSEFTFFGSEEEANFEAGVIEADWDEAEVVEAIEEDNNYDLEETDHEGVTLYEPADEDVFSPEYVAVPDDGIYVIGDRSAVEAAAEVSTGDNDGISDELRTAVTDIDGHVTAAFEVPEEEVPEDAPQAEIDPEPLQDVSVAAFAYDTGDGALSVESMLYTDSAGAAEDIEDVVDGATSLVAGMTDSDDLADQARAVEVDRDDDVLSIRYEVDVDAIEDLVDELEDEATGSMGPDEPDVVEPDDEFGEPIEPDDDAFGEPIEPEDDAFGEPIEPATP